jgi:hypothetical protein
MNKNDFVSNGIGLIEKDSAISDLFKRAKTDQERELMKKGLEQSLETAYNTYAKDYFESKNNGGYISKILRAASLGTGAIWGYAFFAFGGAGFGLFGLSALAKVAAEYIDNKHYEEHVKKSGLEKIISKDGLLLAGEAAGQLAASYIPGGELWAFLRGTKKYDSNIANGALYHAREEFLKRFGEVIKEEPKLVPLTVFRDPRYATNYAFSPA